MIHHAEAAPPLELYMHPEINRSPNGDRVGFLFTWRHNDGSLVTFCPDGWASSDPDKTAWLKAMNGLVSSAPTIPPGVRVWLARRRNGVPNFGHHMSDNS
jgi:hypothetical protein